MQPLGPGSGSPSARIGHYRVLRRLGAGGMGMVYLGYDEVAGVLAAVKVIRPEYAGDPQFRARLRQEVAAARRVPRFCTAPLLAGDLDADPAWVATEYIDAPTLDAALLEQGRLPGAVLATFAAGVAVALREIHRHGVIHRDLKPSNILLSQLGPRVIDFGIARVEDADTRLTRPGGVVGTPAYMAPEQLRGEQVTTAIDIFAWASVVSYAANGRPPFGTGDGVMHAILFDAPDLGHLDGPLRDLVVAAFHKVPAARPSAADLVDKLSRAAPAATAQVLANATASPAVPARAQEGAPLTAVAVTGAPSWSAPAPPVRPGTPAWSGAPALSQQGPPWAWLALGAVALAFVVTVVAGVAIWLAGDEDTPGGLVSGDQAGAAGSIDECALGTWTMTSSLRTWDIAGSPVQMSSNSPSVLTVRSDGTAEVDYGDGHRETGSLPGYEYEILATGTVTLDYTVSDTGDLVTSNQRANGELVVWLNGFEISREPLRPSLEPIQYICDGDSLTFQDSTGTTEYTRAS